MPYQIIVDISKASQMFTKLGIAAGSTIPLRAFTAAAQELQLSARASAPIRTGNLRNSIQPGPASASGVTVEAGADYAAYVELGTRYMSARPYMKPNISQAIQALVDTAIREINQASKV